jgi:peptidoglycan/LPS O-acetylase OafA/YrhL
MSTSWSSWFAGIFFVDYGRIGVVLFIIISGAVMELNHSNKVTSFNGYLAFEIKRLMRIYPAYWISLALGILLALMNGRTIENLFIQSTGFTAFVGQWNTSQINGVGWCIGLFVLLYLLYPLISWCIRKRPYGSMTAFFFISSASILLLNEISRTWNGIEAYNTPASWFPLAYLMWFGLGVLIVNKSWYPKVTDTLGIITYLGELSFYVFLCHYLIIRLSGNLLVYIVYVIGLSVIMKLVDDNLPVRNLKWTEVLANSSQEIKKKIKSVI